ncbi:Pyrroline-5-carboxylate reductase [Paraliobacillus sp. PM-2]|uniref:pyrroline-5-carboxylate reductase n=1 Tax=Paraliobacillus sp. PM-2 TaxID=1462524 RepID=UPI00061CA46D|nr:pyrroline-5-carboxylate reductase [Paraliobacillus sp. PM-2]CQR48347.1 Pyrroline-5-carboxylate reductase [Paraliobacillus sp. PM-2]
MSKVVFIGAGRMAQSIIAGLTKQSHWSIVVSNNGNVNRLEEIEKKYGVQTTDSWKEEIDDAAVIVLAMPPEAHDSVLKELALFIDKQLVITVAAGIGPSYLEEALPEQTPVAWLMPNTAASKGKSMTLCAKGTHVEQAHESMLAQILASIGTAEIVSEEQVHTLTPITGSAPAFVYQMADCLIQPAKEAGISEQQARKLVADMIAGAAAMLQSGDDPQRLIDQVATPGGVTAAGLDVLEQHDFNSIMKQVIKACHDRSNNEKSKKDW